MRNWIIILLFFCLGSSSYSATNPVKIRRICNDGVNVSLFWYATPDICPTYQKYYIWYRNGTTGPFTILDSISNIATETYTHIGANTGAGIKKWFYYIQYYDSCGINFSTFSDTIPVDVENNFPSYIDSVSVDQINNKVIIGWNSNKAPDFALYIPYIDQGGGSYTSLPNTKDTFITDFSPGSDPSVKPLRYDLNAQDSCGNPATFGINPHQTIFLTIIPDTCKKEVRLNWTAYVGWAKIKKYYIYKAINGSPLIPIDSVNEPILSYTDPISLGDQVKYFIRARKDTNIWINSSSNLQTIITRQRSEPLNTYLQNVSVDPLANTPVTVAVNIPATDEWLRFDIYRSNSNSIFSKIGSIANNGSHATTYTYTDPIVANEKYLYQVSSINLCNIPVAQSNLSISIFLTSLGNGTQNLLSWNNYFSWDSGVEKYNIYRGTNDNSEVLSYDFLGTVSPPDSSYLDKILPDRIGSLGICYYIEAIQNPASAHGIKETSYSNHSCVLGDLIVYVPNAFNPEGINKTFRPEGSYIDYKKSSMEIFDRWGGRMISITDISSGWDGKDQKGQPATQGVYFYKIRITGTNGSEQTKTGTVTLLN